MQDIPSLKWRKKCQNFPMDIGEEEVKNFLA